MPVYVIHPINNGRYVKIGFTINVEQRISELKIAYPCALRLVASFRTENQKFEKFLHTLFEKYHKEGEWFSFNGKLKILFESMNNDENELFLINWFSAGRKIRNFFLTKLFRINEIDFLIFWIIKGDKEQKRAIEKIIQLLKKNNDEEL